MVVGRPNLIAGARGAGVGGDTPNTRFYSTSTISKFSMLSTIRSFSSSAMRALFARVQLLGTVGNVYFKELQNGTKFILYSLAVNRYNPQEESNKQTDWYSVAVFDEKQIATFEKVLKPGMQLYVEADAKQRPVTDEQSGANYVFTSLKQRSFDVVRFAKRQEDVEEQQ